MRRVGLHLTDRCQLDCDHCLRDPGARPLDLGLETVARVLAEAAELGVRHVSLTGGEPTLHPRFPAVLDLVVARGMTWDMVSNGRRFDRVATWLEEVPARREACRWIALSMDGATDETHDSIRGAGQRREVLAAAAVAVALGLRFGLTMTVNARNAAEIEALGTDAEDLGAAWVRFGAMQATGTPLDLELRLGAEDWRAVRDRVRLLGARLSIPVLTTAGWPTPPPQPACEALRGETLHVDVRGRLTLCCLHAEVPYEGEDRSVVGEIAASGLESLQGALAALRRAELSARGPDDEDPWRDHGCNSCLRRFGRPHWTDDGVAGPAAARDRWRGAWRRPGVKRALPLVR